MFDKKQAKARTDIPNGTWESWKIETTIPKATMDRLTVLEDEDLRALSVRLAVDNY
jgi:hypothetical protein